MNDSKNNGASAIKYIIVGIFIIFLLLGIFPMCLVPTQKATRSRCLRNLKQIGLALKQYALDYNETLPFGDDIEPYQAFGKLHPYYLSSLDVFVCPHSRDHRWDANNAHLENNKDNMPFTKDTCKRSLSYAYGHDRGKPWTENASSDTRIAGDKYANEDYSKADSKKRPSNHKTDGRNVVYLDGSARWDNNKGFLEADPETEYENSGKPESDQTGSDWWSDPPEK